MAFDDMTKQIAAEKEYKNLRNNATSEQYQGNFDSKHYVEVNNKAILPEVKNDVIIDDSNSYNFTKAAKEYWSRFDPQSSNKYLTGEMLANMSDKKVTIDILFDKMFLLVKDCIGSELLKNNLTTEPYKEHFKLMETSFKMLSNELIKAKAPLNVKGVMAMIQGFINGYIEKTKSS